jgi:integrase
VARKVKDKELDSRAARSRLKPRGKVYWHTIERGLHVGYRRLRGKSGTWWARHYIGEQQYQVEPLGIADDMSDPDGVAVLDFDQAVEKARASMVTRAHTAAGKGPFTVARAIEVYVQNLEDRGQRTYDARKNSDAHILPAFGETEVAALTTEQLRSWHAALARSPRRVRTSRGEEQNYLKPAANDEARRARRTTANRILTILRAALNFAWREGKVPSNSAWTRVQAFEDVDVARGRYLSIPEAQRLVRACDPAFRPMVEAALASGARYSELCRLVVHDFDHDAGTVHVRRSKSGKARHVILNTEGVALFERLTVGKPGSALILPRPDGGAWTPSQQRRPMIEACERAKIKPRLGFHGLRHCWCSLAVKAGVPLMVVARNLGHVDTRQVEKHYAHLAPSFAADTIRAHFPTLGIAGESVVAPMQRKG